MTNKKTTSPNQNELATKAYRQQQILATRPSQLVRCDVLQALQAVIFTTACFYFAEPFVPGIRIAFDSWRLNFAPVPVIVGGLLVSLVVLNKIRSWALTTPSGRAFLKMASIEEFVDDYDFDHHCIKTNSAE
jgi:hypothetical protein